MSQEDESQSSQFSIPSAPSSPIYQELPLNKKKKFDDIILSDSTPQSSKSSTSFNISRKQKKWEDQGMKERSRKRLELLEKVANGQDDEVDLFFKSIALKVKKMEPHLITKSQLRVLTVISQIEEEEAQSLITEATTSSFTIQTNTHSLPTYASNNSFPTQTNLTFPTQANTQFFTTPASNSSFPIQTNPQSFSIQANPTFPPQTNTQSFSTQLNILSPNTTWPQNTSKKQYLSEHTTQHTQPLQESFPENP